MYERFNILADNIQSHAEANNIGKQGLARAVRGVISVLRLAHMRRDFNSFGPALHSWAGMMPKEKVPHLLPHVEQWTGLAVREGGDAAWKIMDAALKAEEQKRAEARAAHAVKKAAQKAANLEAEKLKKRVVLKEAPKTSAEGDKTGLTRYLAGNADYRISNPSASRWDPRAPNFI